MKLAETYSDLIVTRPLDFWYKIPVTDIEGDAHRYRAVCRDELDLTIAWGAPSDEELPTWAAKTRMPNIKAFWADIYWRGSLIDRFEIAVTDHGVFPMPNENLRVTLVEVAIAELIHELRDQRFELPPRDLLEQIGATIVDDVERQVSMPTQSLD